MADEKLKLKAIKQVGIVVEDIWESVKKYWDVFGIGPWSIYTAAPPQLTDTTVYGKPQSYSMKLAHTRAGSTMLELIQPLDGKSIYREFLDRKGEGIHHIASYEVDDVDEAIARLKKLGIRVIQSGRWRGAYFVYLDTEKSFGGIIELVKRSTDFPPPEATYPSLGVS